MSLVVVTLAVGPADAKRDRIRMHAPVMVEGDTARLKGTVSGLDTVRVQRYGKSGWRIVKSVRANGNGVFRTHVRANGQDRWFRAVAGDVRSRERLVPAAPTFPAAPPVPTDECGVRPSKADGSRWSCTLADEFNGTQLDRSVWTPQTSFAAGSPTGHPCYIDDPSVISVAQGSLHLSIREVPEPLEFPPQDQPRTAHVAGMVSDLLQVQPAALPLRGPDQEHSNPGPRSAGGVLALTGCPLPVVDRSVARRRRDRHRRDLLAVPRPRDPLPALHGVRQLGSGPGPQHGLGLLGRTRGVQHLHAGGPRRGSRSSSTGAPASCTRRAT